MIRLLTIALFPLIAACATTPKPVVPDVPAIAPKTTVVVPAELIAPCPPLAKLDTTRPYNEGDTLDALTAWFNQYDLCAARFRKYVDLTGKALNINEAPVNTPSASK